MYSHEHYMVHVHIVGCCVWLEPHFPSLIPKLYRYKYDPVPRIQQSRLSIWNSITTESNKTVSVPSVYNNQRALAFLTDSFNYSCGVYKLTS